MGDLHGETWLGQYGLDASADDTLGRSARKDGLEAEFVKEDAP